LRIYHVKESTRVPKLNDDEYDDHQPFPTLQHVLEHFDPHVGFNVEIKWTMQLKVNERSALLLVHHYMNNLLGHCQLYIQDGTFELYHPFELNLYLDTIIKPVLQYGGSRKIIFSCFHPDICTMYNYLLSSLSLNWLARNFIYITWF